MKSLLLISLALVSGAAAADVLGWGNNRGAALGEHSTTSHRHSTQWKEFRTRFGHKTYDNATDEEFHAQIYRQRLAANAEHNARYAQARYAQGQETYTQGSNQFSDMTESEYRRWIPYIPSYLTDGERARRLRYANLKTHSATTTTRRRIATTKTWMAATTTTATASIPTSVDLRTTGEISLIRNQQGLDCWPAFQGAGCSGGWPVDVFDGAQSTGITIETQPYTAQNGYCQSETAYAYATNVFKIPTDIDSIKAAIVEYGALSILVDATQWYGYAGGIFSATYVGAPDHAVNIIGYGSQDGTEYWLVRNSWGTTWGEDGYMRMLMHSSSNSFLPDYTYAITM